VGIEFDGDGAVAFADVFLPPEVSDGLDAGEVELVEADGDFSVGEPGVKEAEGPGSVGQGLGPYLAVAGAGDPSGFFAEGVLIDGEDFVVGNQVEREVIQLREVAAEDERGRE